MDMVLQSLSVMLMGMCGIFIVMGIISVAVSLLNRFFIEKKLAKRIDACTGCLRRLEIQ